MPKIFISYRRADSRKDASRIYDRLVEAFGKSNIFKDVDNIPFGRDFRGVLSEAVNQCDVMLVVIGQHWINIEDESGNRRLDNPADFVRIEVQTGLQRGDARCLVIPVLVDNAEMPPANLLPPEMQVLAFKNAVAVRDDPDFHNDMFRLITQIKITTSAAQLRRENIFYDPFTDPDSTLQIEEDFSTPEKAARQGSINSGWSAYRLAELVLTHLGVSTSKIIILVLLALLLLMLLLALSPKAKSDIRVTSSPLFITATPIFITATPYGGFIASVTPLFRSYYKISPVNKNTAVLVLEMYGSPTPEKAVNSTMTHISTVIAS